MESFFAPHLYFLESFTSLEEVCEMSEEGKGKGLSKGGRNKLVQESKSNWTVLKRKVKS
jgi:hypothetical protein